MQAEQRSPVVQQVELDITTAPQQLPLALFIRHRIVFVALCDREIRREERLACVPDKRQHRVAIVGVGSEVVEKSTADPATFVAMVITEVVVAGGLKRRVVGKITVSIARVFVALMKMAGVVAV